MGQRVTAAGPGRTGLGPRVRNDRGDVPGWVLVTLMTAGLVVVLWAVAGAQLTQVFQDAINNVTGPGT